MGLRRYYTIVYLSDIKRSFLKVPYFLAKMSFFRRMDVINRFGLCYNILTNIAILNTFCLKLYRVIKIEYAF